VTLTQAQIAADITNAFAFGDGTVAITYGSTTVQGYFDRYDEGNPMPGADRSEIGRWYEVRIPTGSLGALTPETPITVNGVVLQFVEAVKDRADGLVTILYCQSA
jgi:hypothetical protein